MSISVIRLVQVFLLLVSLEMVALMLLAWLRRKRAPESLLMILLLLSVGIYAFGYAAQVEQRTLAGAIFWRHFEYLGIPWIPTLWLFLVRAHNHMPSRRWMWLSLSSLIFIAEFTNGWHGLYNSQIHMIARPPFEVMVYRRGPLAWANLLYYHGILVYCAWIYLSRYRQSNRLYRKQCLYFVATSLLPLIGYLLYLFDWSPWGLDLAPVTMGGSALLAYEAIVRLEFFDIVPRAHSLVFDNMRDAVLISDLRHRLVDMNPAARHLLADLSPVSFGSDLLQPSAIAPVLRRIFDAPAQRQQLSIKIDGQLHTYELRALALQNDEQLQGWAILWADVSAQMDLMDKLRRRAETDELTGIANRRAFWTALQRERSRALRHHTPFALLLLDVDHFKETNDRLGHAAGDTVLSAVASRILLCLRKEDLLCRFGGDEFAVLLTGAGQEAAREAGERMRQAVASTTVGCENGTVTTAISLGIALFDPEKPLESNALVKEADEALYRAKAAGRNCVAI